MRGYSLWCSHLLRCPHCGVQGVSPGRALCCACPCATEGLCCAGEQKPKAGEQKETSWLLSSGLASCGALLRARGCSLGTITPLRFQTSHPQRPLKRGTQRCPQHPQLAPAIARGGHRYPSTERTAPRLAAAPLGAVSVPGSTVGLFS